MHEPIRIVAAVIRDESGRILLVRKRDTVAFMQPGGKREPDEDDTAALGREILEELGCTVKPGSLRYLKTLTAPAANETGRVVEAALYHAEIESRPAISAEIAEMCWIDVAAPPDIILAPLTRDGVLPLLRGEDACV
ncbi:NUDIX hydrolase [Microvirga puerhi]|uniref:NUDIX domain-containing protein n=1 Tax=Microvirga puerhi TaxID=2876078 RepID=A0ABS7VN78_9HYPH|nr:NUDIX domain-containing protein [Microvirga puerhi]MBZ6076998.1 NUDIX domain-containing protein [Microvirga puerhi]